jgi:hypothetical protein
MVDGVQVEEDPRWDQWDRWDRFSRTHEEKVIYLTFEKKTKRIKLLKTK